MTYLPLYTIHLPTRWLAEQVALQALSSKYDFRPATCRGEKAELTISNCHVCCLRLLPFPLPRGQVVTTDDSTSTDSGFELHEHDVSFKQSGQNLISG